MVITSHPSQEGNGWATILWDNAIPAESRVPFSQAPCPQDVSWKVLIGLINLIFVKEGGAELSEENKAYLKQKLLQIMKPRKPQMGNEPDLYVSYRAFCKDEFRKINIELLNQKPPSAEIIKEPDGEFKHFSFWMWVWSSIELLKCSPHSIVRQLWSENNLIGFISEPELIQKLITACEEYPDTSPFIFRFPEGRPESIGLYFLDNKKKLIKITYSAKQLEKQPLQDRILKNHALTHLYPNKEKSFLKKANRERFIEGYHLIGLQEYWPSDLIERMANIQLRNRQDSESGISLCVPSPSTSSTSHSHSYHSYSNLSQNVPSPSAASDNSNSPSISNSYQPNWPQSTTPDTSGLPSRTNLIQNWIQDGISASALNF